MEVPPQTMKEIHFHQLFKRDLKEAYKLLLDFSKNNNNNCLSINEARNIYQECYTLMYEKFYGIKYMDLKTISPALYHSRESELEMPGFAQNMDKEIAKPVVKITSFCLKLLVLKSKE